METVEEYIYEQMKWYALNIDEYSIGQIVYQNGKECRITNKTANSIEVFTRKTTDEGVDSSNWYTGCEFKKLFKNGK